MSSTLHRAVGPLVIAAASALFGSPTLVGAGLVNGSFETGSYSFAANGSQSLPVGSTVIDNWTTFGGELAVVENVNTFGVNTPFGNVFLDLTGFHDAAPYGGVMQSTSTTIGQTYLLSLDLGVNNGDPAQRGPISANVQAGSGTATFTANPTGTGNIWTPFSLTFVADSASTTIAIQGTQGIAYIGLDNVALTPASAVPEPSSAILLGVALGAVALLVATRNGSRGGRR